MNPLQELKQRLADRFPEAALSLDTPVRSDGTWSLDAELGEQALTIEWQTKRGFGISSLDEAAFGEGHDEIYPNVDAAWNRLKTLLLSGVRTQAPPAVHLRRLREFLHLSQAELASKLHVGQAAISKLERRSDVLLSTLASAIAALGGQLEITARFPERVIKLVEPTPGRVAGRKKRRSNDKRRAARTRAGGLTPR